MPIYEFQCRECGAEFEKLILKAADRESLQCPACASGKLEEVFSGFASPSGSGAARASSCAPSGGG